jgi:UDP:flavonoid glycosyltransferase YjiC (YdhE family)
MAVPMIVFPLGRDQPRNGARVAFHRLGIRGNFKHLSPQLISSLIDRIDKDPSFKSNVEAMSRRFREMETLGRGAKIIDKTLQALKQKSA